MRSGCAARIPCFTVTSNSVDRLMRLRAESTARKPVVTRSGRKRAAALTPPAGHDRTARHGSASATGSRVRGLGAGCSAGRSACPWPRHSPRCVFHVSRHPAARVYTRLAGRSESGLATAGRRGPQAFATRVAAVSPTFGRLFEGTDESSPGQTWPSQRRPHKLPDGNFPPARVYPTSSPPQTGVQAPREPKRSGLECSRTVGSRTENC